MKPFWCRNYLIHSRWRSGQEYGRGGRDDAMPFSPLKSVQKVAGGVD